MDDNFDDILDTFNLIAVMAVTGAVMMDERKNKRPRYDTLHIGSLLSPLRGELTPWEKLLREEDNSSFIRVLGFGVCEFKAILKLFGPIYETYSTKKGLLNSYAHISATGRPRSVNSEAALGLVLHWYRTSTFQQDLSFIFGVTPCSISKWLNLAKDVLLHVLLNIKEGKMGFPSHSEIKEFSNAIERSKPNLKGCWGFIDGLNLRVQSPCDPTQQNALHNGWKSTTVCSNLFVFTPDGCVALTALNYPGSWHDSCVGWMSELFKNLQEKTPDGYFIAADSAFPESGCMGEVIHRVASIGQHPTYGIQHQISLVSVRQSAEWGMRALQGAFPRLKTVLPANGKRRLVTLHLATRLHNLRTRLVGHNHITTTWMPELLKDATINGY